MPFSGLIACQQKNWFHRLRKVTCSMQGECLPSVQYQFFAWCAKSPYSIDYQAGRLIVRQNQVADYQGFNPNCPNYC